MLKKLAVAFVVLVMFFSVAVYWFFYDNRMPGTGTYKLDMAEVRREATRIPGPKVLRIEVETLSRDKVPQIAMVAGTTRQKMELVRNSYRLVFPDSSMIVDTGNDAETAKAFHVDSYDSGAWDRMLVAMDQASVIVVTHEHTDHIGGLLASPNAKHLLTKSLITKAQFEGIDHTPWPQGSRENFKPIDYDSMLAIAPGVVLIRAPGHTPGSQMIYVQRADGQEFLFMGDVASSAANVALLRIRARIVTDLRTHEDRNAVMLETQALHKLAHDEPNIVLIPGHDGAAIADLEQRKLLLRGFSR